MENENFYFCSVQEDDKSCPRMNECKRFLGIKNFEYDKRKELGTAKLYNICKEENNYKMQLK